MDFRGLTPCRLWGRHVAAPIQDLAQRGEHMPAFRANISRRGLAVRFFAKPSDRVRGIMKAAGFRWSSAAGEWSRRGNAGTADFLAALDKATQLDTPPAMYALHTAQAECECAICAIPIHTGDKVLEADGRLYCGRECWDATYMERAKDTPTRCHDDPHGVDTLWEDDCARRCGL